MDKAADQGWDQLQARISQMLGKYVGQELPKDYRPKDADRIAQKFTEHEEKYHDAR